MDENQIAFLDSIPLNDLAEIVADLKDTGWPIRSRTFMFAMNSEMRKPGTTVAVLSDYLEKRKAENDASHAKT